MKVKKFQGLCYLLISSLLFGSFANTSALAATLPTSNFDAVSDESATGNQLIMNNITTGSQLLINDVTTGSQLLINASEFTVESSFNLSKLEPNKTISATAKVTNHGERTESVLAIVALFDKDNTMLNLSYISRKIEPTQSGFLTAGFKLPEDVTGLTVKAFVWDGETIETSNGIPLSNVVTLGDSEDAGEVNKPVIEFEDLHPNLSSLDAVNEKIVAISGATVENLINQVRPADAEASYTYKVVDWFDEEKVSGSNLDILTTGDKLIVSDIDFPSNETEYTIEVPGEANYWNSEDYNNILAVVKENLPKFGPMVYDITDAKYANKLRALNEGGKEIIDYTEVFRAAIAECAANGGGTVLVPASEITYRTGSIQLDDNVNLHVEEGARIDFIRVSATRNGVSMADDLYPRALTSFEGIDYYGVSAPIYAYQKRNIAVTGGGIIEFSANWEGKADLDNTIRNWNYARTPVEKRDTFALGLKIQPNLVQIYDCKNVILSGVTLGNSPMWSINIVLSENVLVRGMAITSTSSNSDGCNPESSKNVIIENNFFANKDDNIAFKSGRTHNGTLRGRPTENVIIRNNEFYQGTGISVGSEAAGGARNIFIENNFWNGIISASDGKPGDQQLNNIFRIKFINCLDAVIENIYFRNIAVGGMRQSVVSIERVKDIDLFNTATGEWMDSLKTVPTIRNIAMSNMFTVVNRTHGTLDSQFGEFIKMEIQDLRPIDGFRMKDIDFKTSRLTNGYLMVNSVNGLEMDNVRINDTVYNTEKYIEITDVKANGVTLNEAAKAIPVMAEGDNGTIVVTGAIKTDIEDFDTTGSVRVSYDIDGNWAQAGLSKVDGEIRFEATLHGVGADIHNLAVVAKSNKLPHYVASDNESHRRTNDMVYHDVNTYNIDVEGTLRVMDVTYHIENDTEFHNVPVLEVGQSAVITVEIKDAKTGEEVTGATLTIANQNNFNVEVDGYKVIITATKVVRNHIGLTIQRDGYVTKQHTFRRVVAVEDLSTIIP